MLRGKNNVEVNSCLRDSMVHVVNWIPSSYCALIEGQRLIRKRDLMFTGWEAVFGKVVFCKVVLKGRLPCVPSVTL